MESSAFDSCWQLTNNHDSHLKYDEIADIVDILYVNELKVSVNCLHDVFEYVLKIDERKRLKTKLTRGIESGCILILTEFFIYR